MTSKEVAVKSSQGLHANAKSLLGVLSLGITGGTTIMIIADGQDENEAVEGLANLVQTVLKD